MRWYWGRSLIRAIPVSARGRQDPFLEAERAGKRGSLLNATEPTWRKSRPLPGGPAAAARPGQDRAAR